MGSIRRKGNGWEGRITIEVDGRTQRLSFYDKELVLVRKKLDDVKYKIYNQEYVQKNNLTIEKWIIAWLNECKKPYIRPNTFTSYVSLFKTHIQTKLGQIKLENLTKSIIQGFVNDLIKLKLSPKTIREIYRILKMCLDEAVERNYISKNCSTRIILPERNKREIKILDEKEEIQWLKLLKQEELGIVIEFILLTGVRCGELCGIKWKNIDFKNKIVSIENSFQEIPIYDKKLDIIGRKREISKLKTRSSIRQIPIQNILYEDLLKYKKDSVKIKDDDFVFLSIKGQPLITDNVQGRLKRFIKRHNLKSIGVHALRHTFASRCIEANMNAKVLQDILGHSDFSTTANCYLHITNNNKMNSMDKLSDYMRELEDEFKE